jgi:hypothetical protein
MSMNEIDEVWQKMMQNAVQEAKITGRNDIAEYIELKLTNDTIRSESSKWLFNSLTEIFQNHNKKDAVTLETENPHRFEMNNASMVGSRLRFNFGVRCLDVEAGWTRTPTDGFMRKNALAVAKISHFGIPKSNQQLVLLKTESVPKWFILDINDQIELLRLDHLHGHFSKLFD